MSEYWDQDYFEAQSEADQIVEEAVDKLQGLISEKTKAEIERYKEWYKAVSDVNDKLQKHVYEQQEKINALEIDLKRAKEELERKDNEIPKVPFMPGDKIWWIGNTADSGSPVVCTTCGGKGTVEIASDIYGPMQVTCPRCKGKGKSIYSAAKAYPGYVVKTGILLNAKDSTPSFSYSLVETEKELTRYKNGEECYTFSKRDIYRTEEEAKKVAEEETKKRRERAEKELSE